MTVRSPQDPAGVPVTHLIWTSLAVVAREVRIRTSQRSAHTSLARVTPHRHWPFVLSQTPTSTGSPVVSVRQGVMNNNFTTVEMRSSFFNNDTHLLTEHCHLDSWAYPQGVPVSRPCTDACRQSPADDDTTPYHTLTCIAVRGAWQVCWRFTPPARVPTITSPPHHIGDRTPFRRLFLIVTTELNLPLAILILLTCVLPC